MINTAHGNLVFTSINAVDPREFNCAYHLHIAGIQQSQQLLRALPKAILPNRINIEFYTGVKGSCTDVNYILAINFCEKRITKLTTLPTEPVRYLSPSDHSSSVSVFHCFAGRCICHMPLCFRGSFLWIRHRRTLSFIELTLLSRTA